MKGRREEDLFKSQWKQSIKNLKFYLGPAAAAFSIPHSSTFSINSFYPTPATFLSRLLLGVVVGVVSTQSMMDLKWMREIDEKDSVPLRERGRARAFVWL